MINRYKRSELRDDALDRISEIYATWIKDYAQADRYAQILVKSDQLCYSTHPKINKTVKTFFHFAKRKKEAKLTVMPVFSLLEIRNEKLKIFQIIKNNDF